MLSELPYIYTILEKVNVRLEKKLGQDLSINVNCWTFALASLDRQTDKETYQNMAVLNPTYSLQLVYI